jgi:hypothetical protein
MLFLASQNSYLAIPIYSLIPDQGSIFLILPIPPQTRSQARIFHRRRNRIGALLPPVPSSDSKAAELFFLDGRTDRGLIVPVLGLDAEAHGFLVVVVELGFFRCVPDPVLFIARTGEVCLLVGWKKGGRKGRATYKAEPSGSMLAGTKISSKNWVRTGGESLDTGWKGEE